MCLMCSKVLNIDKKRDSWWFAKNLPEVLIKSNKVAAGAAVWQKIQLGFLLRLRSPQSASSVELCTMLYILYNVQYTQTYDTPISELIKVNYCTKLIPFQNLSNQLITEHCNKKYFAKKYIVQPHIERKWYSWAIFGNTIVNRTEKK